MYNLGWDAIIRYINIETDDQGNGIGKDLEKLSLETVKGFLSDSRKANYKIDINSKWNLNRFLWQAEQATLVVV